MKKNYACSGTMPDEKLVGSHQYLRGRLFYRKPAMGFTKLDESILLSSIMHEDPETFKVWIAILAATKEDGIARVSSIGLAGICFLSIESVKKAIQKLEAPDPDSRSLNNEGRRIKRVDGGYEVYNYLKYRELTHREAEAKRKYIKYHSPEISGNLQDLPEDSASASASASSSGIKKEKKELNTPLWKQPTEEGFQEYIRITEPEFDRLMENWEWISEQKEYYPGVSIRKSVEKAWGNFWGTKAGWENRRKKKAPGDNWPVTVARTIKMNLVYWGKNEEDIEQKYINSLIGQGKL